MADHCLTACRLNQSSHMHLHIKRQSRTLQISALGLSVGVSYLFMNWLWKKLDPHADEKKQVRYLKSPRDLSVPWQPQGSVPLS